MIELLIPYKGPFDYGQENAFSSLRFRPGSHTRVQMGDLDLFVIVGQRRETVSITFPTDDLVFRDGGRVPTVATKVVQLSAQQPEFAVVNLRRETPGLVAIARWSP